VAHTDSWRTRTRGACQVCNEAQKRCATDRGSPSSVGRQFTCANNLPEPTYEKLDRVLMDSDWEDKYPMVSVRALERIESLSDHAPILLTAGSTIPHWLVVSNLNLDGFTGGFS
jgi:endonuclease/exonuclease/phosphatase family metal-dependent hydrolase